jgi:hypothetical protein
MELAALYIYCVHHQNITIGSLNQFIQFKSILHNLNIYHTHLQNASLTLHNSHVNQNKLWTSLLYSLQLLFPHIPPPSFSITTQISHLNFTNTAITLMALLSHQKKNQTVFGNEKKPGIEFKALINVSLFLQDYEDSKTSLELSSVLYTTPSK